MTAPSEWLVVEARAGATGDGPETLDAAASELADALLALGGRAVREVDGWLETHLPVAEPGAQGAVEIAARLRALSGLAQVEVRTRVQPHEDWAELWKRGLEPRRVGERFVITPSWCMPSTGPDDEVLVLDPGMAFGNAEHGTTRGCLRLLEKAVRPGACVLDVGSGSGVLAIAAARLGAERVVALEYDEWAIGAARENLRANAAESRVELRQALADVPTLAREGPVDGVVANIEVGVLAPLMPGFRAALRSGGWLILSGILDTQLDDLLDEATPHGFTTIEIDADGEWRSALLRC